MKKLTLAEFTQVAEIIGAVAIVVSLVFVGLEIQQNTNQSKAESVQTSLTFFNYINDLFINPGTAELMMDAVKDFNSLSDLDKVRIDGIMANISSAYVLAREYHNQGFLSDEDFSPYQRMMAQLLISPGINKYWQLASGYYPEYLRDEWNELIDRYAGDISFAEAWELLYNAK